MSRRLSSAHFDVRDSATLCLELRKRAQCGYRNSVAIDPSCHLLRDFGATEHVQRAAIRLIGARSVTQSPHRRGRAMSEAP